jgi:hypothetical protein
MCRGAVREWIKLRERNEALGLEVHALTALYILDPAVIKRPPRSRRCFGCAGKVRPPAPELQGLADSSRAAETETIELGQRLAIWDGAAGTDVEAGELSSMRRDSSIRSFDKKGQDPLLNPSRSKPMPIT